IVVDNFYEIQLLESLLKEMNKNVDILLRVTPGVESETHQYIMTGNEDSKFGFNLSNGQAEEAFKLVHNHQHINFKGLHCHIGSQIFEPDRFVSAAERLFEELAKWKEVYGYIPKVLN